ncbi:hypothetical protein EVAR_22235_1 [Eumeta japonica]|uniref:PBAN-type neuropeptides n=1 Tax=Eumeta variegata TaxID=151549 RepID=A0A4C1UB95_EUMVA|nr:hypothetical protein EVAR_22235_1 [Eumeta japonica]
MFSFTTPKALYALLILNIFNFNTPAAADGSNKVPSLARVRRSEDGYRGGMWFGPRLGKRSPLLSTDNDRQAFYSLMDAVDTLKYYYDPHSRFEPRRVNEPTKGILGKQFVKQTDRRRGEPTSVLCSCDLYRSRFGLLVFETVHRRFGETPQNTNIKLNIKQIVTKKVVFTPMLGRSVGESRLEDVYFDPRLGRRQEDGVTPADRDTFRNDQDSVNDQSYFSPRLGRRDFSPRLGRDLLIDVFPRDAKVRVARSATNKTGEQ